MEIVHVSDGLSRLVGAPVQFLGITELCRYWKCGGAKEEKQELSCRS